MLQSVPKKVAARKIMRVRIKNAGGQNGRYVLIAEYAPTAGVKKLIASNHLRYGKSWATKEEINDAEKTAFVGWINSSLAHGGGSSKNRVANPTCLPVRSSVRMDASMKTVADVDVDGRPVELEIEAGVLQCVKFLIHNVVHRARHEAHGQVMINLVQGKERHRRTDWVASQASQSVKRLNGLTKRMRAAKLSQRRSKRYAYRVTHLKRAAAMRSEEDLQWLEVQHHRLATVIARQDLLELLPEGEA